MLKEGKLTKMDAEILVSSAHTLAIQKGFWLAEDLRDTSLRKRHKMRLLTHILRKLGDAHEALAKRKPADLPGYTTALIETVTTQAKAYEDFIRGSFEDEIAGAMIRMLDFCGAYFGESGANLVEGFNDEIKHAPPIIDFPAQIFSTCRSVTDIRFSSFPVNAAGEALARMYHSLTQKQVDVDMLLSAYMKYMTSKPNEGFTKY